MRTYVWMSGWQLECCGSSFGVGESVQWPVGLEEPSGTEELLEVLDGDWARRVQYREDHHQVWASGVLTGTVASIDGVTCSTKLVEEIAKVRVPGSGRVLGVPDLEAAYPVASDQRTLVGWVIGWRGFVRGLSPACAGARSSAGFLDEDAGAGLAQGAGRSG